MGNTAILDDLIKDEEMMKKLNEYSKEKLNINKLISNIILGEQHKENEKLFKNISYDKIETEFNLKPNSIQDIKIHVKKCVDEYIHIFKDVYPDLYDMIANKEPSVEEIIEANKDEIANGITTKEEI